MRTLVGALRSTGRPRLLLVLWALTAGPAAIFAWPLERQASALVDKHLAAESMLRSDDGLAGELLIRHGATIVPVAVALLLGGLLVHRLLLWIAAGGVLASLSSRRLSARELLAEAGRRAPSMLRIGVVGLVVEVVFLVGAAVLTAFVVGDEPRPRPLLLGAVAVLLLIGLAHLLTDYARALACAGDGEALDRSAWRLLGRAVVVAWRGRATTLALLLFASLGWLLPTVIYVLAAAPIDPWPTHGFAVLLVLRHLTILVRCWTGATTLAAAATVVARQAAPPPSTLTDRSDDAGSPAVAR